ncbi:MAG: transketolase [Candidatus Eisenbacteria bacterium]|nr:transketolase [Candidatus Eisenbacteria bacterium]
MTDTSGVDDAALARLAVNTIRFLAVDAVERAKSGHPGMPMGMADTAFVLWTRFLRYQPQDRDWPDRDRFVLSAGHGSMLLYAMLHLAGYDLPLAELERFRRLGSRTPGHPEHGHTPGVETTTGPLGQGFANGVGMAVAARMLGARFNDAAFSPVTHRVFGIVSDGDLMEGVASEAASLAGHWGLGNLIYVYDDNHVSIEGDTALAWSEDVAARFAAYGWQVQRAPFDDHDALAAALERAVADTARPSLIMVRSHIGYGAPTKQDTREAHGEPLGAAEAAGAKRALGWPESPPFLVPDSVRALFVARAAALRPGYDAWRAGREAWRARDGEAEERFAAMLERRVPADLFDRMIESAPTGAAATRAHGHVALQTAAALVPSLVGGSADLEPSTKTAIDGAPAIERDRFAGRNFHFGIREHAMAAIANGMALHGGFIPYGSSFLIFTDYARPALRLSALMHVQTIWVFTHDSVFLGEDGPTHQSIEQLTTLRAIPNFLVVRPADGLETAAAWAIALERRDGPTLIALTRQTLPALERPAGFDPREMRRGGYVLRESAGANAITLIATGSEVALAVEAAQRLEAQGVAARVVSMPAPQRVLEQEPAWRDRLLPPVGRRVSIEAGATDYWWRFCGAGDLRIGIDRFGASAPLAELQAYFGFTPDAIAERIRRWVG